MDGIYGNNARSCGVKARSCYGLQFCLFGTVLGLGWNLLAAQNDRSSLLPVLVIARLE